MGVIGTALAYALWFRGIYRLKTSAVVALSLTSPVIATLVGYLFLHQTLTLVKLLGVVIVMGSILLGQQSRSLRQRFSTLEQRLHHS